MGNICVAVLLSDYATNLSLNPRSGAMIAHAMNFWESNGPPIDFPYGQIISRDHADGHQIVVVHGNTGYRLTDNTPVPQPVLAQLVRCLERHYYKVTKLKEPPPRKPLSELQQLRQKLDGDVYGKMREALGFDSYDTNRKRLVSTRNHFKAYEGGYSYPEFMKLVENGLAIRKIYKENRYGIFALTRKGALLVLNEGKGERLSTRNFPNSESTHERV